MPVWPAEPVPRLPTAAQWWNSSGEQLSAPLLAQARGRLQSLLLQSEDEWTSVPLGSSVFAEAVQVPLDAPLSPGAVQVQTHSCDRGLVYRSQAELRCAASDVVGMADNLLSALTLPSLVPQWAPLVEAKRILSRPRHDLTVERVTFHTGWPIAPVEALALNQTWRSAPHAEGPVLLRVSTCLPTPDGRDMDAAPSFFRPQPPYVRRGFDAAWVVEQKGDALLLTHFWSDNFCPPSEKPTRASELHAAMLGLIAFLAAPGSRAGPLLTFWGKDVRMHRVRADADRSTLKVEYTVSSENSAKAGTDVAQVEPKVVRLLLASDEKEGWDITCNAQASSAPWKILVRLSPHRFAAKEVYILHDGGGQMKLRIKRTRMVPTFEPGRVRINGSPIQVWPSNPLAPLPPSTLTPATEHSSASIRSFSVISTLSSFSYFSSGTGEKRDGPVVRYPSPPGVPTPSTANEAADLLAAATGGPMPPTPRTWDSVFSLFPSLKVDVAPPLPSLAEASGPPAGLAAEIQRTYIYFMSLLEMPDAKWSALAERTEHGVGVSMSQLRNALDSKVVVYRAQATFVGLSIWDWLACLSGPGAGRQLWDDSLESAELLEDWGACSSLWKEKTKGWWPVSARDSILVQTTYKSPTCMHIFGFTPPSHLLAGESKASAPPSVGTIRTQVDLRGWCIEKLSPTTVRVTLVEQSDPNGWTRTATAVPAAMALAVGGVGHSALQAGPPPFLVNLSQGTVRTVQYDPASLTFSLCYAPKRGSYAHIRCDSRGCAKSGGMEVEVHPPPRWANCLHRHRLHPRGGGTWLTLAHETKVEVRVRVRPLRHPPDASLDDIATVLLNGEPMRVNADELSCTKILDLTSSKRTSLLPAPLDRGLLVSHFRAPSLASLPAPRPRRLSDSISTRRRSLSLSARSEATSTTLVSTASDKSEKEEDILPAQTTHRDAMSGALDGLFLLRRIESSLAPDPAAARAGWAPVAPLTGGKRGIYISRKLLPSFSSHVATARADTILPYEPEEVMTTVQGLSSTAGGWWDSALPLAQFGSGAGVACMTKDHLPWPFSKRLFCLGSLSALSSTGSYLYATASCTFEAVARLVPLSEGEGNLNPRAHPVGKVLLDGWIMQPHAGGTRLTHLLAWDWGASVPASMKAWYNLSLLNEHLARLTDALANPIPHFRIPGALVQVRGDPREITSGVPWVLSPAGGQRVLEHTWDRVVCLLSPSDGSASPSEGEGNDEPVLVLSVSPGHSAKAHMRTFRGQTADLDAPFSGEELTVQLARPPKGPHQVQVYLSERPSTPFLIECTLTDAPAEGDNVQPIEVETALPVLRQDPNGPTYVPKALQLPIGVHHNLLPRQPEEKAEEVVPCPVVQETPLPASGGHRAILLLICFLLSSLLYFSHSRSEDVWEVQSDWAQLLPPL